MIVMVGLNPARGIPITFMHRHPLPGVAGGAAVGEIVGRVRKDQINGLSWQLREHITAIALVQGKRTIGGAMKRLWHRGLPIDQRRGAARPPVE